MKSGVDMSLNDHFKLGSELKTAHGMKIRIPKVPKCGPKCGPSSVLTGCVGHTGFRRHILYISAGSASHRSRILIGVVIIADSSVAPMG